MRDGPGKAVTGAGMYGFTGNEYVLGANGGVVSALGIGSGNELGAINLENSIPV